MATATAASNWRVRVMNDGNAFLFINSYNKETFLYTKQDIEACLEKGNQITPRVPLGMILTAKTIVQAQSARRAAVQKQEFTETLIAA